MAVNEQIVTGRKFRKLIDEVNKIWQRISFWTKASDVEFNDGKNAETKIGAINGVTDSLTSTASNIAASAAAVKALNDKVTELNSNICKKNLLNIELRAYTSSSSDITGTLPQIPCENYKKIRIRGSSSDRTHSIYTPSGTLLLSAGTSTSYGNEADISKIDHFIPYCSLGTSTLYYMFTE